MATPEQASGQLSRTSSSGRSFVDPAQQPFLDFLRYSGRYFAQQGGGKSQQFGLRNNLYERGAQNFLPKLQNNRFLNTLYEQAQYNPQTVNQQFRGLRTGINRAYEQDILPNLNRDYQGIGAFGGDRNYVTRGIAEQGRLDALTLGRAQLIGTEADRATRAALTGSGILQQGLLGGLQQMPNLFNLGLSQYTGGFNPLLYMDQIVGVPTILDKQKSSGGGVQGFLDF